MSEQPVIGHMSEVTSVSLNTANKPINRIIPELYSLLSLTVTDSHLSRSTRSWKAGVGTHSRLFVHHRFKSLIVTFSYHVITSLQVSPCVKTSHQTRANNSIHSFLNDPHATITHSSQHIVCHFFKCLRFPVFPSFLLMCFTLVIYLFSHKRLIFSVFDALKSTLWVFIAGTASSAKKILVNISVFCQQTVLTFNLTGDWNIWFVICIQNTGRLHQHTWPAHS